MKKIFLVLIVVTFAFASFAMQEAFNASSYEYQMLFSLCRAAGVETEQLVSPISADQMLYILNTIPEAKLTKSESSIKSSLIKHLEEPYMVYGKDDYGFDAIITSAPDFFFHTAEEEVLLNESVETRRDILPFFQVGGKVYFSKYFFGTFEYNNTIKEIDRKSHFSTNYNFQDFNVEISSPYKAYVSAGNNKFNFIIGRDQLSLGKGKTGNLLLGDNFLFEDFTKFSYFNDIISYDMTMITFDVNDDYRANPLHLGIYDFNSEHQLVVVHQLSFKPVSWLNLSMSEGMLQYGKNLYNDISIISPFMMLHDVNSYMKNNANNFFSIDLSVAVAKGWEVNASAYFDQIQQSQELDNGKPTDSTVPNANAFLLNTTYSTAIMGGMADFYVEGVYTNPAVYLKNLAGSYTGSYNYYDTDLIVGNALSDGIDSDISYLGYKYGPDTIVLATGVDYNRSNLQLSFDTMFKIHGEKGMKTYANQNDCNSIGVDAFYEKSPTGTPEYRLSFVTTAKYSPFDWLTVNSQLGYIHAWNYHNNSGLSFNDLQLALGVKINPVHLAADWIKK